MTKNYATRFRNITAACLALVIFASSSMIALAGDNKSLMGEITVSGKGSNAAVLLNGENALTGRTFFSNGTITTSEDVTSTVKLGNLGYVTIDPNTTLTLSFDEKTISGTISAGHADVYNAEGVAVNIQNLNEATTSVASVNEPSSASKKIFGGNSAAGPLIVFGGIVAAAIILVVANSDSNSVTSPTR